MTQSVNMFHGTIRVSSLWAQDRYNIVPALPSMSPPPAITSDPVTMHNILTAFFFNIPFFVSGQPIVFQILQSEGLDVAKLIDGYKRSQRVVAEATGNHFGNIFDKPVRSRVEELIDYLLRKRSWIGDDEGRQAAGLWIASTRVEKWNDIAVSERCKHRGMSWKQKGVLAIALHAAKMKQHQSKRSQTEPKNHTNL